MKNANHPNQNQTIKRTCFNRNLMSAMTRCSLMTKFTAKKGAISAEITPFAYCAFRVGIGSKIG